jgi:hypothetical protein
VSLYIDSGLSRMFLIVKRFSFFAVFLGLGSYYLPDFFLQNLVVDFLSSFIVGIDRWAKSSENYYYPIRFFWTFLVVSSPLVLVFVVSGLNFSANVRKNIPIVKKNNFSKISYIVFIVFLLFYIGEVFFMAEIPFYGPIFNNGNGDGVSFSAQAFFNTYLGLVFFGVMGCAVFVLFFSIFVYIFLNFSIYFLKGEKNE